MTPHDAITAMQEAGRTHAEIRRICGDIGAGTVARILERRPITPSTARRVLDGYDRFASGNRSYVRQDRATAPVVPGVARLTGGRPTHDSSKQRKPERHQLLTLGPPKPKRQPKPKAEPVPIVPKEPEPWELTARPSLRERRKAQLRERRVA